MGWGLRVPVKAIFHCDPNASGVTWVQKKEARVSFFSGAQVRDPLLAFLGDSCQGTGGGPMGLSSEATGVSSVSGSCILEH